jgi:hypothetical protein
MQSLNGGPQFRRRLRRGDLGKDLFGER